MEFHGLQSTFPFDEQLLGSPAGLPPAGSITGSGILSLESPLGVEQASASAGATTVTAFAPVVAQRTPEKAVRVASSKSWLNAPPPVSSETKVKLEHQKHDAGTLLRPCYAITPPAVSSSINAPSGLLGVPIGGAHATQLVCSRPACAIFKLLEGWPSGARHSLKAGTFLTSLGFAGLACISVYGPGRSIVSPSAETVASRPVNQSKVSRKGAKKVGKSNKPRRPQNAFMMWSSQGARLRVSCELPSCCYRRHSATVVYLNRHSIKRTDLVYDRIALGHRGASNLTSANTPDRFRRTTPECKMRT